jgi:hypothetical protein
MDEQDGQDELEEQDDFFPLCSSVASVVNLLSSQALMAVMVKNLRKDQRS